ncbi:MAG: hypothetical protein ACP5IO_04965 [Elusimicrobiales bacterium]
MLMFLLSSCSSNLVDVIKTGPDFTPSKNVEIFTSRDQIKKPYGAVAILHSVRFDCSASMQKKILKEAVSKTKRIGGDAIVYYFDYSKDHTNAIESERCYMSALAVKYVSETLNFR